MKRKTPKPPFSDRLKRSYPLKPVTPYENITLKERALRHARNHPNDKTNGRKA